MGKILENSECERLKERLLRHSEVMPNGCIEWTGCRNARGYGDMGAAGLAHRASWAVKHRRWPDLNICHTCDNPPCIHAGHLFEGTHADNRADSVAKGRHARGEKTGSAKLTEEQVREIRRRAHGTNVTYRELAEEYGVALINIWAICQGRAWKHSFESEARPKRRRYEVRGEMLTLKEVAERYELPISLIYSRVKYGQMGEQLIRPKYSHT